MSPVSDQCDQASGLWADSQRDHLLDCNGHRWGKPGLQQHSLGHSGGDCKYIPAKCTSTHCNTCADAHTEKRCIPKVHCCFFNLTLCFLKWVFFRKWLNRLVLHQTHHVTKSKQRHNFKRQILQISTKLSGHHRSVSLRVMEHTHHVYWIMTKLPCIYLNIEPVCDRCQLHFHFSASHRMFSVYLLNHVTWGLFAVLQQSFVFHQEYLDKVLRPKHKN